jgi:hypothetical protein
VGAVALTLGACGGGGGSASGPSGDDGSTPEGSPIDGTTTTDANDAGNAGRDAPSDTGSPTDAPTLDEGPPDSGVPQDAPAADEGPPDSGNRDSALSDTGTPDSGIPEAGEAGSSCTGNEMMCGGQCVDTLSDHGNCGGCSMPCGANQVCAGGTCHTTCGTQATCLPDGGAPYCADTTTDNANCGTCGNVCPSGTVCSGSSCGLTCGSLTMCTPDAGAAYCANTMTDNANCGTCGNVCPGGDACMGGMCQASCPTGDVACSGVCTNTQFDPGNCGGCNNACTYAHGNGACASSSCILASCTAPYKDCDDNPGNGCETNVGGSDTLNCGACGHACGLGETCNSGVCTFNYTTNLLGWWQLNDAAGSATAADSSGNNLTGKVVGSVTFVPGSGTHGNGAALFGGGSPGGYVTAHFPNTAAGGGSGLYLPQGNITFAMWFKVSVPNQLVQGLQATVAYSNGYDRIVGNGGSNTGGCPLTGPTSPLCYNAWNETNFQGTTTVDDGSWHQMVFVLDETNGFFAYVDGVLDGSSNLATTNCGIGCSGFNWATDYVIGSGDAVGTGRFGAQGFKGYIEDVRLYNVPLTATGVQTLYNATK